MLTVDQDSDDFKFFKTLNEDVKLKQDDYNRWDIQFENQDYVNITGKDSLVNAICIAIMTRFNELDFMSLYEDFGCRAHELIKANKSDMVKYKIELFVTEVLENMRRVFEVNEIEVTDSDTYSYNVFFNITAINDEIVQGSVSI